MSRHRKLLWFLGALCLFRLVAATTEAQTTVHYNDGDIFIGFRATGGTGSSMDYLVDIGQPSQIMNGLGGPMAADLVNTFGSDWYTRIDPVTHQPAVLWSIVGGRYLAGGGDPTHTLYATNPSPTPWPRHSNSTQGVPMGDIRSMEINYDGNPSTVNNPRAVIQVALDQNSYAYFQPGGVGSGDISFQNWNPTIEGYPSTTLTVCRIIPGIGPSQILGTLSLSNMGVVTFGGPPRAPTVVTNPATAITSSSATLNGTVNPNGLATMVSFQYGTTTNYEHTTAVLNLTGNTTQAVVANIAGLTAGTVYHFRIVASNGAGTSNGSDVTFTTLTATGPPLVTTSPATSITNFSATLNGSVNPRGLTTTVYFQYGTTTSYGHTTAVQTQTGNTSRNVSANITGLNASTIYHFRIVASNSGGTRDGSDITFTTLGPTGPPVAITTPASNITSALATLNGTLDPHGLPTLVYFQYGTTTSYGHTTPSQSQTGSTFRNISANISGLNANTTYHFRIVATNSGGIRYGSDVTFTTLTATGPPVVTTTAATNMASFSATLNGSLDPHGLTTTIHFQYGTTTSYGLTTAVQTQTGSTFRNVAANISGLSASTIYHFRIVATNSAGTTYGGDRTFTTLAATGPPIATTNPATNIGTTSATLDGSLDPHGLTTTVHFQYGTTTSYGHNTPTQSRTGNTFQTITANVTGLTATTLYHFRIVATNSSGTTNGSDRTFTTH